MNVELKAMLKAVMDVVATGKAIAGKHWDQLFACLVADGSDVPSIVANWADLKAEAQKLLSDPTADADLLAYAASLVGGESPAVAGVVVASADLFLTGGEVMYQKVVALIGAIEIAKKAAAAPAAPAPAGA